MAALERNGDSVRQIDQYINPSIDQTIQTNSLNSILISVNNGSLQLAKLVEMLGEYLTNLDDMLRSRATLLLAEILTRLPKLTLDRNQVHFLTVFFCDRMQDYPSISEVLKGVLAIVKNHKLDESEPETIVRAVFQEVHVGSQSQSTRKAAIELMSILLDNYYPTLKKMGTDFVFGIVQIVDGERDPRNLLIAFRLISNMVKKFPEDHLRFAEEIFEITSCYFPIMFNPRQNDPNTITKEDLVNGLRQCFSASSAFAQYLFPFLLDKLSSNISSTKLESMNTLVYCIKSYGSQVVSPYVSDIWGSLRMEILSNKENEVVEHGLETVREIVVSLSSDLVVTSNPSNENGPYFSPVSSLSLFLAPLIRDCMNETRTLNDTKLARMCGKVVSKAASGSISACQIVLQSTLPLISEKYKAMTASEMDTNQLPLLDLITDLIRATYLAKKSSPNNTENRSPLNPYKDVLLEILTQSLLSPSPFVRSACVEGLSTLIVVLESNKAAKNAGTEQQILMVQRLTKILIEDREENVQKKSLDGLLLICKGEEGKKVVLEHTIPYLLTLVTSEIESSAQSGNSTLALKALSKLSSEDNSIFSQVTPSLLAIVKKHSSGLIQHSHEYSNVTKVIETLSEIVDKVKDLSSTPDFFRSILPDVVSLLISKSLENSTPENEKNIIGEEILDHILQILKECTVLSNEPLHTHTINSVIELFVFGLVKTSLPSVSLQINLELPRSADFFPLQTSSPLPQKQLVSIFNAIISQSRVFLIHCSDVIEKLLSLSQDNSLPIINISSAQCLSSIINKLPNKHPILDHFLEKGGPLDKLVQNIITPKDNHNNTTPALDLNTLIWVTKGLNLRNHPYISTLAKTLCDIVGLSERDEIPLKAAEGFETILSDDTTLLNKNSGAIIKVLYKQKFFSQTFPLLLDAHKKKSTSENNNSNNNNNNNNSNNNNNYTYLIAIFNLLKYIPKSVLISELSEVLPLLIQALSFSSSTPHSLHTSSLFTLSLLLQESPNMISEHVNTLLPMILNLATSHPSSDVRGLSLEVVRKFSSLPYNRVFPHKQTVIRLLGKCLDDKKRNVRREAVKARNEWFVMREQLSKK